MILQTILLVFPLMMVFAAISDLLTMRITNWIPIVLTVVYLAVAPFAGVSWQDMLLHLGCGFAVLVVTFGMFARGWMGGGDAKLAAATAIWMGWAYVLPYLVYGAMLGGLLTLGLLTYRSWQIPLFLIKQEWAFRLHKRTTGVPYGIALAAAGLIVFPYTDLWRAAAI